MAKEQAFCFIGDCDKEAHRYGMCWMHAKRFQREQRLNPPPRSESYDGPFGRLMEAAVSLNDLAATDDEGWFKARDRIRKAAVAYVRALSKPVHKASAP